MKEYTPPVVIWKRFPYWRGKLFLIRVMFWWMFFKLCQWMFQ